MAAGTAWLIGPALARQAGAPVSFLNRPASSVQYLKASNAGEDDRLGIGDPLVGVTLALSADGNTLAVGAPHEDSSSRVVVENQSDNSAESAGAAYVFTRRGTAWSQQAYLKASNADAGDQFGWSIALNGDGSRLAVGALTEAGRGPGMAADSSDNSAVDAGAVYVFARSGTAWTQDAYLKASNAQAGDRFGFSVALSADGNSLVAGSYDEDGGGKGVNPASDEAAQNSGAAYLFVRRGGAWAQDAYLKASNTVPNMSFGSSVAISPDGGTLAVGAVDETNLTPGIDRDQTSTPNNAVSAGAVFVFARTDGWHHQAYIKSSNIGGTDLFGFRLAFSRDGNILAAGAPGQGGGGRGFNAPREDLSAPESGAVYVFTRAGTRWTQQAYMKAPNAEEFDQVGSGVALSSDGGTLAVSAGAEDGGGGINGNQADSAVRDSGVVYVF